MSEFISSPFDVVDLALVLAGIGVLTVWVLRWRRQRPRDPLRGAPIRANLLSLAWMWLALFSYGVSVLIAQLLVSGYSPAGLSDKEAALQRSLLAGNLAQLIVIGVSLWILSQAFAGGLRGAGLGRTPLASDLRDGLAGFLVAFSLCTMTAWLTEHIALLLAPERELPVHMVFETFKDPATPPFMHAVAIIGAMLLAPVGEELLFRGIFQTGLRAVVPPRPGSLRHRWFAIVATSLAFGLMHVPLFQHIPALVFLALILGYQYERSGSLRVPILVHVLFNTKSVLWYWLQKPG